MNEKPKSQKGMKRIRGAAGQKGKPLFIPFYVDLEKLKNNIKPFMLKFYVKNNIKSNPFEIIDV
jgi:hypothetical protein